MFSELTAKVWSDIFDRYNVSDTENVWVKLTETNHVKSFDDVAFFPEDSYGLRCLFSFTCTHFLFANSILSDINHYS